MKIEIRIKTDRTTALTLAEQDLVLHRDFVRSPMRGNACGTPMDYSDTGRANPALRFAKRRDRIHPLLGERAGVREDIKPFFAVLLAITFCLSTALSAHAQYSIDWYKVSGGGGTSTGGVYSVSGTIGQHDAGGPMTGGSYSLTGGFWALYAVQTPGAPVLTIKLTTTNTAQIYWPSPSTGFNLQVNTNLATANWVTPAESVTDNGTIKYIIVNPPTGNRFYRLKNP